MVRVSLAVRACKRSVKRVRCKITPPGTGKAVFYDRYEMGFDV